MIRYISTRGEAGELDFENVLLSGLASDGGLYVPQSCPLFTPRDIEDLKGKSYQDVVCEIIRPFIGDAVDLTSLRRLVANAYRNFDHSEIAPLVELEKNFKVMELFHGPTLAFKDFALQLLGQLFDHVLEKHGQRITIVGATSGDTGSAAIEACRDKKNLNIFILHPKGRVSEVQRCQMTTVDSKNVFNIAIDGSFDDCQDLVKAMFTDATFRGQMKLSAINSINWARIMAQVAYYAFACAKVCEDDQVAFAVPTGNFGNVYAGYVAKSMGFPILRLIVGTNKNDILHRFFETGLMQQEPVTPTLSPSMDIQISSNFERLLFDLYGRQGDMVKKTMLYFRERGPFRLDEPLMKAIRSMFESHRLTDADTLKVMRDIHLAYGYNLDPHSAIGVGAALEYRKKHPGKKVVALATAHPAKFPDAAQAAIGRRPSLPKRMGNLFEKAERCETLPNDLEKVKSYIAGCVTGN